LNCLTFLMNCLTFLTKRFNWASPTDLPSLWKGLRYNYIPWNTSIMQDYNFTKTLFYNGQVSLDNLEHFHFLSFPTMYASIRVGESRVSCDDDGTAVTTGLSFHCHQHRKLITMEFHVQRISANNEASMEPLDRF